MISFEKLYAETRSSVSEMHSFAAFPLIREKERTSEGKRERERKTETHLFHFHHLVQIASELLCAFCYLRSRGNWQTRSISLPEQELVYANASVTCSLKDVRDVRKSLHLARVHTRMFFRLFRRDIVKIQLIARAIFSRFHRDEFTHRPSSPSFFLFYLSIFLSIYSIHSPRKTSGVGNARQDKYLSRLETTLYRAVLTQRVSPTRVYLYPKIFAAKTLSRCVSSHPRRRRLRESTVNTRVCS